MADAATPAPPKIQFGQVNKGANIVTVNFPTAFDSVPIVTVSAYFPNQGAVSGVDTITQITPYSFTVTSINAGDAYFINWIALAKVA